MSAPDTVGLTKTVGHVAEAQAVYREATRHTGAGHEDLFEARQAAEDRLVRQLTDMGAAFSCKPPDHHAIRLAGIRSTSTSSYAGAVGNWLTAARKRLEKADRPSGPSAGSEQRGNATRTASEDQT